MVNYYYLHYYFPGLPGALARWAFLHFDVELDNKRACDILFSLLRYVNVEISIQYDLGKKNKHPALQIRHFADCDVSSSGNSAEILMFGKLCALSRLTGLPT